LIGAPRLSSFTFDPPPDEGGLKAAADELAEAEPA
jgi:hypothetical protein